MAETYLPRARSAELPDVARRMRAAAREMAIAGSAIRYVRSTFVPEDETCFHLFEATSSATVSAATQRAVAGAARVVEALREESGA